MSFIEKSVFYVVLTENLKFVDILKNLKIFLIGTILVNTLVVNILCNGRLVSIGSTLRLHRKKIGSNPRLSTGTPTWWCNSNNTEENDNRRGGLVNSPPLGQGSV